MKLKNIRIPFFILAGLIITSYAFLSFAQEQTTASNNIFLDSDQDGLSDEEEKTYGTDPQKRDTDGDSYSDGAEIASGYDPLKPAPDDRLASAESTATKTTEPDDAQNMTQDVAQKISAITSSSNLEDQEITLEEVQKIVNESLNGQFSEDEMPGISVDDLKIKQQDYSNLSSAEAEKRRKEDFVNYIVAVSYILSSNSPKPITSDSNFSSLVSEMGSSFVSALTLGDLNALDNLAASGQKIKDQMLSQEVPEDLIDLHIKGLRFAEYALLLKSGMVNQETDPLANIANLSKIQGLLGEFLNFITSIEDKFMEYGLETDNILDSKLEETGILPQINSPEGNDQNKSTEENDATDAQ